MKEKPLLSAEIDKYRNEVTFITNNYRSMTAREIARNLKWGEDRKAVAKVKNRIRAIAKNLNITLKKRVTISDAFPSSEISLLSLSHSAATSRKDAIGTPNIEKLKDENQSRHGKPEKGFSRYTLFIRDEFLKTISKTAAQTKRTKKEILDQILQSYFHSK